MTETTASRAPVAMISGASKGIGKAIATELLSNGWRVSVGTRTPTDAFQNFDRERHHRSRFDATEPSTEAAWLEETVDRFGGVDAIVHNAGMVSWKSVIDATGEDFDTLFEVNVKSPMRLTQLVWPHLRDSGVGKVIVVASLAGKRVRVPEASLYSMSKAAVLSLAHGIRHCGDQELIRCTAILPGFVATDMAEGLDEDMMRRVTQPEDVAHLARMILELPRKSSVSEIPVNWRAEGEY